LAEIILFYRNFNKALISLFVISVFLTGILMFNPQARGRLVSIFNNLDISYELSWMPFEEGQNGVFIARMFHSKPLVNARRFINEYANYFPVTCILSIILFTRKILRPDQKEVYNLW